jgi:hypothetical protein
MVKRRKLKRRKEDSTAGTTAKKVRTKEVDDETSEEETNQNESGEEETPKAPSPSPQQARSSPPHRKKQHTVTPTTNHRSPNHSTKRVNVILTPKDFLVVKDYVVNKLFKKVKFITTEEQLYLNGKIAENVLTGCGVHQARWAHYWDIIRPQVKPILNQKRSNINGEIKKAFFRKKH